MICKKKPSVAPARQFLIFYLSFVPLPSSVLLHDFFVLKSRVNVLRRDENEYFGESPPDLACPGRTDGRTILVGSEREGEPFDQ